MQKAVWTKRLKRLRSERPSLRGGEMEQNQAMLAALPSSRCRRRCRQKLAALPFPCRDRVLRATAA